MAKTLLIYGSLTGNTEGVAYKLQALAQSQGKEIAVKNALDADLADLQGDQSAYILACSTWDDGLPQADFAEFLEKIKPSSINLADKKVAILGCGDSNYVHFCGATTIIEEVFVKKMGANKIIDTLRIDGYPESEENQAQFQNWAEKLIALLD